VTEAGAPNGHSTVVFSNTSALALGACAAREAIRRTLCYGLAALCIGGAGIALIGASFS